jgi:hypothetical protein
METFLINMNCAFILNVYSINSKGYFYTPWFCQTIIGCVDKSKNKGRCFIALDNNKQKFNHFNRNSIFRKTNVKGHFRL